MATKAKPVEQPANDNLELWRELSKTDPAHTKGFKRAGGFTGTAIKPIWIIHRLTELFGPCGIGWGMDEPQFQVIPGENREVLVYCTVAGWYLDGENRAKVYGVGGDKVVTYIKANEQYKRPERWESDDEAFKKAFTDAIGNAFKFVGVGADVHMGLFDDNKYVAAVEREFREAEQPAHGKVEGITKIKTTLRELKAKGDEATELEAFNALVRFCQAELTKIKDANHDWWTGDGADFEGFKAWIIRRRAELEQDDGIVKGLIDSLNKCETRQQLQKWLAGNGDVVESLDGADSRKFELAYQFRESLINEMDQVGA